MATHFTPFYQAFDDNGLPLNGGLLYFYRTGTTTPLNTYSDSGLTSANANPVVANSSGRFGPIYFGSAFNYKAILKTSANVTIATFDPIFSSAVAGRTAVADANYALVISDRLIAYTSITAARSVSLLAATAYEAGTLLTIVDESGSANGTKTISVVPNGSDTINGANATRTVIAVPYGSATIESDGTSKWTVVRSMMGPSRSYLAGLTTSNNVGTPNTKLDVAAGQCADDTNVLLLTVAAGTIDCGTTGANGLDAGSLANNTWYHAFAIGKVDGTTALLASTSLASPTFPSGYTLKRRIGSIRTDGSAHILLFIQDGDLFLWNASPAAVTATDPGAAAVTRTLTVPTGVKVDALLNASLGIDSAAPSALLLSSLDVSDQAPSISASPLAQLINSTPGGLTVSSPITVRTNTSAQIRSRLSFSNAATGLAISTLGWIDRRGRDA